jgi:hypothetical protein
MNDDWSFEKHVADIESVEAIARAEAAEAEVAKWREMHADRAHDLQHEYARAEALEVEVERLREALAEIASGGCVDPARTAAEALGR